jgi:hypothetical protein
MSCVNSNCYLPRPPRTWSRVQNSCSLITEDITLDFKKLEMLNKGNVLQYKANSSNLTKWQRYSKIATGTWVNRNTTWATQTTSGYTNPNTTSLKRTGNVINIAINPETGVIIGPTLEPPTCLKPFKPFNPMLPDRIDGGDGEPDVPPPIDPTPESDTFPDINPVAPLVPIVIQDGGTLVCSIQENICTGDIKQSLGQQLCHPTTDSDVPGPIQELCWNDGLQTWYPRNRYTMSNSTNKWPVNATLLSAVVSLIPPTVSAKATDQKQIILTWDSPENVTPIINIDIYQSTNSSPFVKIATVPNTFSYTVSNLSFSTTYSFYLVAKNECTQSVPSNIASASISNLYSTTGNIVEKNGFIYFIDSTANGSQTGTITFNYACDVAFTLVAGGSSAAYWSEGSSNGSSAGGGGQILNSETPFVVVAGTTISVSVGSGAPLTPLWPSNGEGILGYNTQITINSLNITTNNATYGGGGGLSNVNISWKGGGGNGSSGGATNVSQPSGGGGGGGGALTTVNNSGVVSLSTLGNNGQSGSLPQDGGNGGNGQLGIDNILYGAGGGGGGGYYSESSGSPSGTFGLGGLVGGGNGSEINPYTNPITIISAKAGMPNTGGGGGGGTDDGDSVNDQYPQTGGSGVVIFKVYT